MKSHLLLPIVFVFHGLTCGAQEIKDPVVQNSAVSASSDFDFWIGEWKTVSSTYPKWEAKPGTDKIQYLLDSTLIEEVFTKNGGNNFQRGYLFYLKREERWKHTIYDRDWGEYSFYGNKEGDNLVLYSDPKSTRPGLRRETFYNISPDQFDYMWEASFDGGKTWNVTWKVHYVRTK